jgi:hypothetical protein
LKDSLVGYDYGGKPWSLDSALADQKRLTELSVIASNIWSSTYQLKPLKAIRKLFIGHSSASLDIHALSSFPNMAHLTVDVEPFFSMWPYSSSGDTLPVFAKLTVIVIEYQGRYGLFSDYKKSDIITSSLIQVLKVFPSLKTVRLSQGDKRTGYSPFFIRSSYIRDFGFLFDSDECHCKALKYPLRMNPLMESVIEVLAFYDNFDDCPFVAKGLQTIKLSGMILSKTTTTNLLASLLFEVLLTTALTNAV